MRNRFETGKYESNLRLIENVKSVKKSNQLRLLNLCLFVYKNNQT